MSDIVKFSIPGRIEYVKMVRMAIASLAGNVGFGVEDVEDMMVSVSEACKLVTCHGYDGFSDMYEVTCEIFEDKIDIKVEDAGGHHGIVKGERPCANCPGDGDLGIFVMDSLMDTTKITETDKGCKCITMSKSK